MKEMRTNTTLIAHLVTFFLITCFSVQAQPIQTVLYPMWTNPEPPISYDFEPDEWYYIAYTKQQDDLGAIFVNGDSIGVLTWEDKAYNHFIINIAASYYTSYGNYFNGTIDEIRISKKIRTASELKTHYISDQSFENDAFSLQIWNFNEGAGDKFYNADNDLSGSIYGEPEWVTGKFGSAIKYDGIDDRSRVYFDTPEYGVTYEFWVKFDGEVNESTQTIIQPYGAYNTQFSITQSKEEPPVEIEDVTFYMSDASSVSNGTITYPIGVSDFQNVLTAQYTISWDPAVVTYQGVQDFGIRDLDEGSFHLFEPGKLTFSWNPSDLQPETVDDGTVIFNVVFKAIGASGQSTDVSFTDVPTSKEITDGDGNTLGAIYINGKITLIAKVVLGGYIKTQKGDPLIGVEVELIGAEEQKTTVDEFGWYSFKVIPNQEYHIAPLFDTNADDGVSTLDIVIMHWHILGKKYMMSNYDLIGSDVNKSKSLSTLDLAETRSVVLHNEEKFRDRNAVEFVNHEYTGDPDVFDYKNYLDITPTQSHLNLNFTAVKLGDAGRNWTANNNNGREQQLEEIEILLEYEAIATDKLNVAIKAPKFPASPAGRHEIVGLQFTLEWNPDALKFEKLSQHTLEFFVNTSNIQNGLITFSWNSESVSGLSLDKNDILSGLEFTVVNENEDYELEITSGLTPALAFNADLASFRIKGSELTDQISSNDRFLIYPNPAKDVLHISGITENARYSIISTTGKTIISGNLNAKNQLNLNGIKRGVYIFQTIGENQNVLNRKFIKQ